MNQSQAVHETPKFDSFHPFYQTRLNPQVSKRIQSKRKLTAVIALVVLAVIAATYFGAVYFFQSPCPSGATLRSFTIIANDTNGYNDSRYQPLTMNVQNGDCVLITFINNSPAQPHGLWITYYVTGVGAVAQPRQAKTVEFQATKTGQFQVGESIFSTIAAWTDNAGVLNVR